MWVRVPPPACSRELSCAAFRAAQEGEVAVIGTLRPETVAAIFDDMRAGVTVPARFTWIEDRRRALFAEVDLHHMNDLVDAGALRSD